MLNGKWYWKKRGTPHGAKGGTHLNIIVNEKV